MPEELMVKFGETAHSILDLRFARGDFVQSGGEPVDFLDGMSRRERHTQARFAAGDGWIPDGRNENSLFAQSRGGLNGFPFVAD
jgi:hypothetical protein